MSLKNTKSEPAQTAGKLVLIAAFLIMAGCGKTVAVPESAPATSSSDQWSMLSFYLKYITVLNNDTAQISRCTSEEIRNGTEHGPACREACNTADRLLAFEKDNAVLMAKLGKVPHKQHKWCLVSKGGHQ